MSNYPPRKYFQNLYTVPEPWVLIEEEPELDTWYLVGHFSGHNDEQIECAVCKRIDSGNGPYWEDSAGMGYKVWWGTHLQELPAGAIEQLTGKAWWCDRNP